MGKKGMGWVPDYPDVRDCTLKHDNVRNIQKSQQSSGGSEVDRARQFLDLIKILKPSPESPTSIVDPNITHSLSILEEEFTQEIDSKLHFVSATFTDGFLSLGSSGSAVQDLQNNLEKLHYLKLDNNQFDYRNNLLDLDSLKQPSKASNQDDQEKDLLEPDDPGHFGKATEAAVKAFQINQELDPTGIYTAVTKAELLALISIVGKLGSSKYRSGVSGPGVIYIQALLEAPPNSFEVDKPLGLFGTKTSQAVLDFQKEFQKEFSKEKSREEAIVDQETWEKLIKKYENEDLRRVLPSAPVPKKRFKELKKYIFRLIKEEEGGIPNIINQLGGLEDIDRFLFDESGKKADGQEPVLPVLKEIEEKLQKRLEPIIEVLIQLATCIDKTLPVDSKFLEEALKTSYKSLVNIVNQPSDSENGMSTESKRLLRLADWLEQGKGYVSSNIFRYPSYQPGVAQPAITYIQERLRALGYYDAPTTGYFDEQITQEAVKRFQVARGEPEPDGKFKLADIEQLQKMSQEKFVNLEPPLPDDLTASLIADLGGLEGLIRYFSKIHIFETIDKIVLSIQDVSKPPNSVHWVEMVQPVIPVNALDSSSEVALKKIAQEINESSKTIEEKQALARQFLELILRFTLYPIAKAIAYLISPIGKYNEPKEAFRDGLRRFRVIAYFSQVQEISRILNGLIVDVSGDIDRLTKEYESLVETLAILKAEFRQQELSSVGLDMFEQLQPLVTSALHKSTPSVEKDISQINQPTQLVEVVKKWIKEQLFVNAERYVTLSGKAQQAGTNKNSEINAIPRGDQTFIRVDLNCDRCSLQLPVTGKMYRALSQQAEECNTTYLILPDSVDLSIWCSEVEDQGELDACTAHAGVALLEYFEKKSLGDALDASRRFLYKVTRNLMHREGDTGASVRETMKAMVLFGVPPEEYCPYDEAKFDDDPSAFCYAFAQNYQTITYFRLDGAAMPARELLAQIKTILVGGFPCMFGFTVYDSIRDKTNPPGHIPYPTLDDKQEGGHAAIAVGYNDYKQIKNATNPGALLIKNSWGVNWGEGGYGWLPYDYVLNGLARDWWSLIKSEWVESKQFGLSSPDAWTANLGDTITSR